MNYHSNAKLTESARKLLVERASNGIRVADVACMAGVSRTTAYKWIKRYKKGDTLKDKSSRPHKMPRKVRSEVEEHVVYCQLFFDKVCSRFSTLSALT